MASSSTPLAAACTTFSLSLFKQLTEENGGTDNVFYSPISISSALAMVLLGARGNTAAQMEQVLCLSEVGRYTECGNIHNVQSDVHGDFSKLMSDLNKTGTSYSLSVANRLYGAQSYPFVEEFLSATKKHYNAQLESVDFSTEAARLNINGWVEKQTQDKIKDLLAKGDVDGSTKLVLVNAIYFKGMWDKPFKARETKDAQFRISKTETKPVKMMLKTDKFPLGFIDDIKCKVLELPYTGKDLSMLIFLPDEIEDNTTGLEKLEKALTYENFVDWTNPGKMHKMKVQVKLPRFKLEETLDMKEVLTKMGMVDAFAPAKCDFSGMSPANDLVLSKVVHKAFVEVNEEGTEAAAATRATRVKLSYCYPVEFVADHPFLFFIRHNPSMSVLFAGRYCSPPGVASPISTGTAQQAVSNHFCH